MTGRARIILVGLAAIVLIAAFVLASGSDDEGAERSDNPPTTAAAPAPTATTPSTTEDTGGVTATTEAPPARPRVPTVRVVGGKPQGGVRRLDFSKGDTIRFRVRSDVADEVHVHGYDLKQDVPAGGIVRFTFRATIDGRFEVELEGRGEQIAELEVQP